MMESRDIILRVKGLKKYFPIYRGVLGRKVGEVKAVDDISLDVFRGETVGVVGESGCGKTTAGRTIIRLYEPTDGHVYFKGVDLAQLSPGELRQIRRGMQMVFQDPYASLNPRMTVQEIVGEPLEVYRLAAGKEKDDRVAELLSLTGLNPAVRSRYPHEFSGGQRQRIGLARALAVSPDLIVCDEPISALDVSIQSQVVNLLQDLQERLGLTYIFIAHDLSMVRHISHRVAVMYLGKIVELADREDLYERPSHPYTQVLLSAIPVPDPEVEEKRQRILVEGDLPSPANPPKGCNFNTRCPFAVEVCFQVEPALLEIKPDHWCACHLVEAENQP